MHKVIKLGVILRFEHNEKTFIIDEFIDNFNQLSTVTFCLVNNTSDESLHHDLKEIEDCCTNVVVVTNKKRSPKGWIRHGERYLNSSFSVKHLWYIDHTDYSVILKTLSQLKTFQNNMNSTLLKDSYANTFQPSFSKSSFSSPSDNLDLNANFGRLS